jgi:hypothetical protein
LVVGCGQQRFESFLLSLSLLLLFCSSADLFSFCEENCEAGLLFQTRGVKGLTEKHRYIQTDRQTDRDGEEGVACRVQLPGHPM